MPVLTAIQRFFCSWARLFLSLLVAVPFLPAACQIARQGVPPIVLGGDGGVLELHTLFASRGLQLLGPYSRFLWSHPGPAFFYLALPFYQAFHQRGAALQVFTLSAHFVAMVALVLVARRLLGNVYALVMTGLLAVYQMLAATFAIWSDWNPWAPILPLALLSFLASRIATGGITALPGFIFVASAVIQTHVGFTPAVFWLCAAAGVGYGVTRWRRSPPVVASVRAAERRRTRWSLAAAGAVLIVMWMLPVYENLTARTGNLSLLWKFFTSAHGNEHTWGDAFSTVASQLALMPLAFVRLFGAAATDRVSGAANNVLAGLQVVGLLSTVALSIRRRQPVALALSMIALGEIAAALLAVRAIRGEVLDYLVAWISVLGFVAFAALAATVVPAVNRLVAPRAGAWGLGALAIVLLALAMRAGAHRFPIIFARDADLEQMVSDVETRMREDRIDHPIVDIISHKVWPQTVGLVVSLEKHGLPVFVAKDWVFMFGRQLAPDRPHYPHLLIGDHAFAEANAMRRDLTTLSVRGDVGVFLQEADYFEHHRLNARLSIVAATGVLGDPACAVDGVIPPEGADWKSSLTVVLGTASTNALEVTVPPGDLAGVFLSVDGNDDYAVNCIGPGGESSRLGEVPVRAQGQQLEAGMRTRVLFSNALAACRSVEVTPLQGDGFYSVGEIGFLRP